LPSAVGSHFSVMQLFWSCYSKRELIW